MKNVVLVFFLLLAYFSVAQQDSSNFYKEDQFYIDANLVLQLNNSTLLRQNGFSRNVHLGYVNDIPLNKKGTRALGIGIGYAHNYLVNNLMLSSTESGFDYVIDTQTTSSKNVFLFDRVQFPIELRFRGSSPTEYAFWRLHLGYRFSYQFNARYRSETGTTFRINSELPKLQHAVNLAVGFNTWNIHLQYDLIPLFNSDIQTVNGVSPKINLFQIGLIFFIL